MIAGLTKLSNQTVKVKLRKRPQIIPTVIQITDYKPINWPTLHVSHVLVGLSDIKWPKYSIAQRLKSKFCMWPPLVKTFWKFAKNRCIKTSFLSGLLVYIYRLYSCLTPARLCGSASFQIGTKKCSDTVMSGW